MIKYKNKTLIVICGPTAVGKTDLSIVLAKKHNTAIISADSRQIYKELTIGTAKPSEKELLEVPHHFINHIGIEEDYSAGRYEAEVLEVCEELFKTKDVVIMCGGSGLYINAVCNGFDEMPAISKEVREEIMETYQDGGVEKLQELVEEFDPEYYSVVDKQNHRRLIRALEVIKSSGKKYSEFRKSTSASRPFNCVYIGLQREREDLYERINLRVDLMIKDGLLQEAKSVTKYKLKNSLQTVGYKELFEHFDGLYSIEEAIELIKRNTRRYAKRQMTWFKKIEGITWFYPQEFSAIERHLNNILKK